MSATIIPFRRAAATAAAIHNPPTLTRAWADQHMPLIEAALVLLHTNDAEFVLRCRHITSMEGEQRLPTLAAQIDRLGTHIADVADALNLTAERIRGVTTGGGSDASKRSFASSEFNGLRLDGAADLSPLNS